MHVLRLARTVGRPALLLAALLPAAANAADEPLIELTFRPEVRGESDANSASSEPRTIEAKVVIDGGRGGLLVLDRAGRLWPVTPQRIVERVETDRVFAPFTQAELAEQLKREFPSAEVVATKHYVVCSEAGREFGRWAGALFERLMGAFKTHWNRRPLSIDEPDFPLAVVILKDKARFGQYAVEDAGPSALGALGYYSLLTNRVVMYDLTADAAGPRPQSIAEINYRLALQTQNVSTVVHEATHQIAFNTGLHVRLADNPFWLVEGMAMYFETPDLKNAAGWRTVGQVNAQRLDNYREYVTTRRPAGSIRAMLTDDDRFHTPETALDAYAEAWALNFFLIKQKRTEYVGYLKRLSEKPPLARGDAEARLKEFEAAFGNLDDLEKEFARFYVRLGGR